MYQGNLYKIKHFSGRILGPLDLARIRKLILKNQINGTEIARLYPEGDWKDINSFPEVADLIVKHVQGNLQSVETVALKSHQSSYRPILGETVVLSVPQEERKAEKSTPPQPVEEELDPTLVVPRREDEEGSRTIRLAPEEREPDDFEKLELEVREEVRKNPIPHSEPTVMISRVRFAGRDWRKMNVKELVRVVLLAGALGYFGYDTFLKEDESVSGFAFNQQSVFRPVLPEAQSKNPDPVKSRELYGKAMQHYVQDHTQGYLAAARLLLNSVNLDDGNVKAISMLASSYINLIDSSNKDENFFGVIIRLIERAKAKSIDLAETAIAESEFLVMTKRPAAAVESLVAFTKKNPNFDRVIHFYAAHAFYAQGDYKNAATQLSQIPDNKAFSAKVFYLRGRTAEALNDNPAAILEYQKALKVNPAHMQSLLRIVAIRSQEGHTQEMKPLIEELITKAALLSPQHQAEAFFYQSKLFQIQDNWEAATFALSRAVRLDPKRQEYLLEYYTLKARGSEDPEAQKEAKMYFFLGEGEKLLNQGDYQGALTQFLQAKDAHSISPVPHIKTGDLFVKLNDMINARLNYKRAAEMEPNSISIWSKYIHVLIHSYEWEEAQKGMDRFRKVAAGQSAIDKLAGDFYAKQNRHAEAQTFYQKAMRRDTIDPEVYIAYARSLMAVKQYKDAPFFFALAQRFDPTNPDAVIGIASATAQTEGLDAGVRILQDEMQKSGSSRAELLAGIAELLIQKGEWKGAQSYVDESRKANPDYAYPWKLQAQIFLNDQHTDKKALDRALEAFKSYSDRNVSDPSGYFERYQIYARRAEFEKAASELDKIFKIYPKYPGVHYHKGALFTLMGNHKAAIEEYQAEVNHNPFNVDALVAIGKAFNTVGDPKAALIHLTKAMEYAPQNPYAKFESANANRQLRNFSGAIALYRAAAAIDTGNPMIYRRMGDCFREMGDMNSARGAFKKYLEMEPDASDRNEIEPYL